MEANKDIIKEIEQKRKEMLDYANTLGLNSAKTVKCSQELDLLLNTYEQIKEDGKNHLSNKCFPYFVAISVFCNTPI